MDLLVGILVTLLVQLFSCVSIESNSGTLRVLLVQHVCASGYMWHTVCVCAFQAQQGGGGLSLGSRASPT